MNKDKIYSIQKSVQTTNDKPLELFIGAQGLLRKCN